MSDDLVPRRAPIRGGGKCDVCGRRSFRTGRLGGWRHVGCEPSDRWLTPIERAARTEARRWGTTPPPRNPAGGIAEIVQLPLHRNGNGSGP